MSEMIKEQTAGKRSEPALAGERSAPAGAAGRAADPEIPQVGKKRRYTTAYKLRILNEIDRCKRGEMGAILRREGLYHSTITKWRAWRQKMSEQGLEPSSNRKSDKKMRNKMKRLERENQKLRLKLRRTEGLIDLQKKALELLEDANREEENGASS